MLIKSDVAKALPLVILPHLALLVRGLTIPSANDTATQQVLANGHQRFYRTHFAAAKANTGNDNGGGGEIQLEVEPENTDPIQVPELDEVKKEVLGPKTKKNLRFFQTRTRRMYRIFTRTQSRVFFCSSRMGSRGLQGHATKATVIRRIANQRRLFLDRGNYIKQSLKIPTKRFVQIWWHRGSIGIPKPEKELGPEMEMTAKITTIRGTYEFKVYSTMDEIYWTQKVNGRWKQYQPVRMDKIDNFLPFSIIKWTRRSPDKTNLWGLVNRESTIIAYGVPMQLPYVINRLWLHFLIKKTVKPFKIPKFTITWKGIEYKLKPPKKDVDMWLYPYFLPMHQRLKVFKIINQGGVYTVVDLPKIKPIKHKPTPFLTGIIIHHVIAEIPRGFDIEIPGLPAIGHTKGKLPNSGTIYPAKFYGSEEGKDSNEGTSMPGIDEIGDLKQPSKGDEDPNKIGTDTYEYLNESNGDPNESGTGSNEIPVDSSGEPEKPESGSEDTDEHPDKSNGDHSKPKTGSNEIPVDSNGEPEKPESGSEDTHEHPDKSNGDHSKPKTGSKEIPVDSNGGPKNTGAGSEEPINSDGPGEEENSSCTEDHCEEPGTDTDENPNKSNGDPNKTGIESNEIPVDSNGEPKNPESGSEDTDEHPDKSNGDHSKPKTGSNEIPVDSNEGPKSTGAGSEEPINSDGPGDEDNRSCTDDHCEKSETDTDENPDKSNGDPSKTGTESNDITIDINGEPKKPESGSEEPINPDGPGGEENSSCTEDHCEEPETPDKPGTGSKEIPVDSNGEPKNPETDTNEHSDKSNGYPNKPGTGSNEIPVESNGDPDKPGTGSKEIPVDSNGEPKNPETDTDEHPDKSNVYPSKPGTGSNEIPVDSNGDPDKPGTGSKEIPVDSNGEPKNPGTGSKEPVKIVESCTDHYDLDHCKNLGTDTDENPDKSNGDPNKPETGSNEFPIDSNGKPKIPGTESKEPIIFIESCTDHYDPEYCKKIGTDTDKNPDKSNGEPKKPDQNDKDEMPCECSCPCTDAGARPKKSRMRRSAERNVESYLSFVNRIQCDKERHCKRAYTKYLKKERSNVGPRFGF